MKKQILLLTFLSIIYCGFSQITLGPSYGVNLSKLQWYQGIDEYKTGDPNSSFQIGWNVGSVANIRFTDLFSMRVGLRLNNMRTSQKYYTDNRELFKKDISIYYFRNEFTNVFSFPVSDKVKVQAIIGLYLQLGLGGDVNINYKNKNIHKSAGFSRISDIDEKQFNFNLFDPGFTVGLGVDINSFVVATTFDLGVFKVNPNTGGSDYMYNNRKYGDREYWRSVNLSVTYFFSFKKSKR